MKSFCLFIYLFIYLQQTEERVLHNGFMVSQLFCFSIKLDAGDRQIPNAQAPVVQTVDNAIPCIKLYRLNTDYPDG